MATRDHQDTILTAPRHSKPIRHRKRSAYSQVRKTKARHRGKGVRRKAVIRVFHMVTLSDSSWTSNGFISQTTKGNIIQHSHKTMIVVLAEKKFNARLLPVAGVTSRV